MIGVVLLFGCRAEPHETGKPGVGHDSGADGTDSDTGEATDSDTAGDSGIGEDTDSAAETAVDTDSGGETDTPPPVDTDQGAVALEEEADAKLIGGADDVSDFLLSIAGGRDADGDGVPDILVGAFSTSGLAKYGGVTYLFHGPVAGDLGFSTADARLMGATDDEEAGAATTWAGDVNGDGFEDILIGAPEFHEDVVRTGQVYVVYGPVTGDHSLADADATLGVEERKCAAYDGLYCYLGRYVAGPGDVNGDGFDDILVSGPAVINGTAFLKLGPVEGAVDLFAEAEAVFTNSTDVSPSGEVAGAGDLDGDGLPDVLVATGNGAFVVYLDGPLGTYTVSDADLTVTDSLDVSIDAPTSSAGDTNGDGYADLVSGMTTDATGGFNAGGAVVFLGPLAPEQDITDADAVFHNDVPEQLAGADVGSAGDVNGDGFTDVLVGDAYATYYGPGTAWLFYGPMSGTLGPSDAGIRFEGEGTDKAGAVVTSAGDIDLDGLDDVLIGGPGDTEGGKYSGAVWLVLGASMR